LQFRVGSNVKLNDMNKTLLILVCIFWSMPVLLAAQPMNCEKFKTGKFRSTFEGRAIVIERSGTIQTESLTVLNGKTLKTPMVMVLNVKWLNDCTYTLTLTAETLKKYPKYPKNAVITVKIIKANEHSYTQSATANFSNEAAVSEVYKVD